MGLKDWLKGLSAPAVMTGFLLGSVTAGLTVARIIAAHENRHATTETLLDELAASHKRLLDSHEKLTASHDDLVRSLTILSTTVEFMQQSDSEQYNEMMAALNEIRAAVR